MGTRHKQRRRAVPGTTGDPPKVYVETSVWGMILDDQPRALSQPTKGFLRQCAEGIFLPCISAIVLQEIDDAPDAAAARMTDEIKKLAPLMLESTLESDELAEAYVQAGVVPAKKIQDARHVAIATVAELEIVVSWNHRHLANERKSDLFNAVNRLQGYEKALVIHTPFEVMQ